jgi:MoxR-like ATPase
VLPDWSKRDRPEQYVIDDDGLVAAINAALILGQPLLLTGEPGTGKTSLAYRVAWQLGLTSPLMFETKSNSLARDLFYTFDAVGRFQAANESTSAAGGSSLGNLPFIAFQALGRAILLTGKCPQQLTQRLLDSEQQVDGKTASPLAPQRSVVLIDEIDKAHRDFPNDLLNEIDRMSFTIPELGGQRVNSDPSLRPIVLITSNSEKNLPDPFLRRCVYYHIEFPKEAGLRKILKARLGLSQDQSGGSGASDTISISAPTPAESPLIVGAVKFFEKSRELDLQKKPATAEMIGWVRLLIEYGAKFSDSLTQVKEMAWTLPALAKNQDDLDRLKKELPQLLKAAGV